MEAPEQPVSQAEADRRKAILICIMKAAHYLVRARFMTENPGTQKQAEADLIRGIHRTLDQQVPRDRIAHIVRQMMDEFMSQPVDQPIDIHDDVEVYPLN